MNNLGISENEINELTANYKKINSESGEVKKTRVKKNKPIQSTDTPTTSSKFNSNLGQSTIDINQYTSEDLFQMKTNSNVENLYNFLAKPRFTRGENQKANISRVEKKSYVVDEDNLEEFFVLIDKCRPILLHMQELQQQYSGIMIDIDRYQESGKDEIGEEILMRFINIACKIISATVETPDKYHIFVTRKPEIIKTSKYINDGLNTESNKKINCYKDGLHILIPEIQVRKEVKKYIMCKLKEIATDIFTIPHKIDSAESMIDANAAVVPVFFYGSAKNNANISYILTNAYVFDKKYTMITNLSAENIRNGSYNGNKINLVYELSLSFYLKDIEGNATWLKKIRCESIIGEINDIIEKKTIITNITDDEMQELEEAVKIKTGENADAKYIYELLKLLDNSYVENYEKWIKVMFAIANTSTTFKDIARNFSMRSPKNYDNNFDKFWYDATEGRKKNNAKLSIQSLIYWAKECNPEKVEELRKEYFFEHFLKLIFEYKGKIGEAHAAEILNLMWRDKYVYTNSKEADKLSHSWYEFVMPSDRDSNNHVFKWKLELDKNPNSLQRYVIEGFPKLYSRALSEIKKKKENAFGKESLVKYFIEVEKNLNSSKDKLSSSTYLNGIMKMCQIKFYRGDFEKILDRDPNYLGVSNGVLDLNTEQLICAPNDLYVCKFIDIAYIPNGMKNKEALELLDIFKQIFIEPDTFNFAMHHGATGFLREPAGFMWALTAGGSNGKSLYAKMLQSAFKSLGIKINAQVFTDPPPSSDRPNSNIMSLRGKTWIYCDESEENKMLNSYTLKLLCSANGDVSTRDLGKKQEVVDIIGNIIFLSNHLPRLTQTDYGTLRRLKIYYMKVKFNENTPENSTNPFERRANSDYINKYPKDTNYINAMFSIILYYYKSLRDIYKGDIKKVPHNTILKETEKYIDANNHVNRFINQTLVYTANQQDILKISTIANKYCEWFALNIDKHTKYTNDSAAGLFEDCKISTHIKTNQNTEEKYLDGWKFRSYDSEISLPLNTPLKPIIPNAGIESDMNFI